MTCREFKHNAASLSLVELTRAEDPQIVGHAKTCEACESWLQKQRSLSASMHALRSRTASLEAGPDVERALLRVFRQGAAASVAASAEAAFNRNRTTPAGVKGRDQASHQYPRTAPASPPFALRLSRFFEIGAYAAVAAAVVVAVLLGIHLLRLGSGPRPVQSQSLPQHVAPDVEQPSVIAAHSAPDTTPVSKPEQPRVLAHEVSPRRAHAAQKTEAASAQAGTDDSLADADDGYTALMFCDPLSCSTGAQVVRMELPSRNGAGQPQAADVVVGYDGTVRAVRFVN
jgi:hypothetical protein